MARVYSLIIAFIGSFLFSMFLCYTDHGTKSILDLLQPGMLIVGFLYSLPFFGIIGILTQLKINENVACTILLFASFLISFIATNPGRNHWLGVAIFTVIYFLPLAAIYLISIRVKKTMDNKRENEDIARQQFI